MEQRGHAAPFLQGYYVGDPPLWYGHVLFSSCEPRLPDTHQEPTTPEYIPFDFSTFFQPSEDDRLSWGLGYAHDTMLYSSRGRANLSSSVFHGDPRPMHSLILPPFKLARAPDFAYYTPVPLMPLAATANEFATAMSRGVDTVSCASILRHSTTKPCDSWSTASSLSAREKALASDRTPRSALAPTKNKML
ncbi:hypothetical protein BJV74DRAFT_345462 [Russula compacta]|nr:hypothetical protein BJV74DRAFT_345462 [Russula compacta]